MVQTPESVIAELKKGNYAPVYFLQGDEAYYIDLISDYIEENALTEGDKGFNQTIIYGKDHQVSQVITNAKRFPMMSQRQVVIVKEAQDLSDLNKEAGQKLLLDYIKNPLASTILVFGHKYKSIDKRKALGKALDKYTVFVSTKKLYDNQVPAWIGTYVSGKQHKIKPKATQMLADFIGNNLERLANEIDKILINFAEKVEIDEAMVQKYVGISKDFNVFELQKALQVMDIMKANRIVNYFESNSKRNPIIPVIAVLFSFYSKLLVAHHSKDKSERALASVLKVNPYFAKDYIIALRHYPLIKVVDNIRHLREADLKSKGVGNASATEGQILRELVFKLMH